MSQTREQQAYQRGIRAARLWQRLKGTILRWDRLCVSKACERKCPAWTGHISVVTLAAIMLAALVFGGMIITCIGVIVSAIILLFLSILEPTQDQNNDTSVFEYKTYGEFGPGWYSGKTKISDGDTSPYDYRG